MKDINILYEDFFNWWIESLSISILWVISISIILLIPTKGISQKLKLIKEEVKTNSRNSKQTTSHILKSADRTILGYTTLYSP